MRQQLIIRPVVDPQHQLIEQCIGITATNRCRTVIEPNKDLPYIYTEIIHLCFKNY